MKQKRVFSLLLAALAFAGAFIAINVPDSSGTAVAGVGAALSGLALLNMKRRAGKDVAALAATTLALIVLTIAAWRLDVGQNVIVSLLSTLFLGALAAFLARR